MSGWMERSCRGKRCRRLQIQTLSDSVSASRRVVNTVKYTLHLRPPRGRLPPGPRASALETALASDGLNFSSVVPQHRFL
ncbi:uncharacterized protein V6R79_010293 [Siganus canaliculatus]